MTPIAGTHPVRAGVCNPSAGALNPATAAAIGEVAPIAALQPSHVTPRRVQPRRAAARTLTGRTEDDDRGTRAIRHLQQATNTERRPAFDPFDAMYKPYEVRDEREKGTALPTEGLVGWGFRWRRSQERMASPGSGGR